MGCAGMENVLNTQELEVLLGDHVRRLRLQLNLTREDLCARAGISVSALRHLETGEGASVKTLIRALRSLNKEDWIFSLAPQITINPLHLTKNKVRQRARKKK